MPFINGRYYVNPIMGEALEAAREAEAALLALENRARQGSGKPRVESAGNSDDGSGDSTGCAAQGASGGNGPIHRVEIEAAELVPAHSGRATRGYVARVHRQPATGERDHSGATLPRISAHGAADNGHAGDPLRVLLDGSRVQSSFGKAPSRMETHVFADHRDLVSFLRDELGKDSHSKRP